MLCFDTQSISCKKAVWEESQDVELQPVGVLSRLQTAYTLCACICLFIYPRCATGFFIDWFAPVSMLLWLNCSKLPPNHFQ